MIIIVATTTEEIKEAFAWLSENTGADVIVKATEIQKQKKADYDKKRYQEKKNSTVENVKSDKEEREEKREGFPPSSPLPFSPNTPYPIPPIIPPSQEKREEREESVCVAAPKNERRDRGELLPFGTHVRLSQKEYDHLVSDFGRAKVSEMIQNLDNYIGEDPKRERLYATRNHNLTLRNWDNRDKKMNKPRKPESPNEYPDIYSQLKAEGVI